MRNTRDKWKFLLHPSKPAIKQEEVVYWKRIFRQLLKVGLEFEFNLPENRTGSCKGDSLACPCGHMLNGDTCWMECTNVVQCSKTKTMSICSSRTEECKDTMCKDCTLFKFECHGINCTFFSSACFDCNKFSVNCADCKYKHDPNKNPSSIRSNVTKELAPSNSYGIVNKSGVHSITKDGSLVGDKGMEVITVGRRVDYWEFFKMSKKIIDASVSKGAWLNERCSTHMHVLAAYYGKIPKKDSSMPEGVGSAIKELEKDIPEIILANFHQLCRRYQNAMTWMTMALDDPEHMTRWEKYRVSILDISAVLHSMSSVRNMVADTAGGNKYGWANYNFTEFNNNGDVRRLHVEMRTPDGIISPSAVAALACMFYALMLKAVEISRHGVMELEDSAWMERSRKMKESIMNGVGSWDSSRMSNTKNVHKYSEHFIDESLELLRLLKHCLIEIGPSYEVLEKLAERPIALRRCDGESWETIENDLKVIVDEEGILETTINEFIDLRYIDECKDMDEWISEVSKALTTDDEIEDKNNLEGRVREYVEGKRDDGMLVWSSTLKSVISIK